MINMLRIVQSSTDNPYQNLALEEILFSHCEESGEIILYLWQNEKTVVIGRNQTVFTECNLHFAKENNVRIARRLTGGGAVYHDLGNLNYTIITPKDLYNTRKSTQVITDALNNMGLKVEANGRNDIFSDDMKISGNAYYSTSKAGLHHGTLLVKTDLDMMDKLLNVSSGKISKAGIASVRMRVRNISDICDISIDKIVDNIIISFTNLYKGNCVKKGYDDIEISNLYDLTQKYSSSEWIFNQVVDYSWKIQEKFPWGNVLLSCEVDENSGRKFAISSDSLYPNIISDVEMVMNESENVFTADYFTETNIFEKEIVRDLVELKAKLMRMIQEEENEVL